MQQAKICFILIYSVLTWYFIVFISVHEETLKLRFEWTKTSFILCILLLAVLSHVINNIFDKCYLHLPYSIFLNKFFRYLLELYFYDGNHLSFEINKTNIRYIYIYIYMISIINHLNWLKTTETNESCSRYRLDKLIIWRIHLWFIY